MNSWKFHLFSFCKTWTSFKYVYIWIEYLANHLQVVSNSDHLLYWKARGCIGSYVGLQMVSILGLVSLYGVLILYRDTVAHVRCALRAMGLHSNRQHSMDPRGWSKMLEILPLDEDDAPSSPLPSQPQRCTMHSTVDPGLAGRCGIPYTILRARAWFCLQLHHQNGLKFGGLKEPPT